jgi:hypothetical protein
MAEETVRVKCHCSAVKRRECKICKGNGYIMVSRKDVNHELALWMVMFNAFYFQSQKLQGNLAQQIKMAFNDFFRKATKLHGLFMKNVEKDNDSENINADHSTFILQIIDKASKVRHRGQLLKVVDDFIAIEDEAYRKENPKYSDKLPGPKILGKIEL